MIRKLLQTTFLFREFSNLVYYLLSFGTVDSTIDSVGIRWLISGTEGEIKIKTPEMLWQLRQPGWALKIKKGNGKAKDVEFSIPEENYPGSFLGSIPRNFMKCMQIKRQKSMRILRVAWLLIWRFKEFFRLPSKGCLRCPWSPYSIT